MATLRAILMAITMLMLGTPGFAEDAHHPEATGGQTGAEAVEPVAFTANAVAPMAGGMMAAGQGQTGQGQTGQTGMGAMALMIAPEYIEGRIAFLKAELRITPEQEPLWNAFAEALRANTRGIMDGMMQTQAAMGRLAGAAATPLQRVDVGERALASRLESVRKLKAALVPLYQSLEGAQKQAADKLLMPPMMGIM
ncbi:Spy/CpxP family protein refolding chaperone [Sinorhizobium meliloti]|uniref:Spy/CpxP family protein refolding chaperone n=1 Tax=Rhizobium meliloti TaxID=382 RepID=UPI003F17310C